LPFASPGCRSVGRRRTKNLSISMSALRNGSNKNAKVRISLWTGTISLLIPTTWHESGFHHKADPALPGDGWQEVAQKLSGAGHWELKEFRESPGPSDTSCGVIEPPLVAAAFRSACSPRVKPALPEPSSGHVRT